MRQCSPTPRTRRIETRSASYNTVMLSAAKHLSAHRDRPFAALRVTIEGSPTSSQASATSYNTVMLSAAKHLSAHRDRPFAALRVTIEGSPTGCQESAIRIVSRFLAGVSGGIEQPG